MTSLGLFELQTLSVSKKAFQALFVAGATLPLQLDAFISASIQGSLFFVAFTSLSLHSILKFEMDGQEPQMPTMCAAGCGFFGTNLTVVGPHLYFSVLVAFVCRKIFLLYLGSIIFYCNLLSEGVVCIKKTFKCKMYIC